MSTGASLKHLTETLKTYRSRGELSLSEMAARTNVSIGTVRRIERGENVSVETLLRIAESLDVSTGYLLGEEDRDAPRVLDPLVALTEDLDAADIDALAAIARRIVAARRFRGLSEILALPELTERDRVRLRELVARGDEQAVAARENPVSYPAQT